jgi:hypothetical protein
MTFTFLSCAGFLFLKLFTRMTGFSPFQIANIAPASPAALIRDTMLVQGFENLATFLLPAVIFAYLATPRPADYLGLRAPRNKNHLIIAPLVMLGAAPLLMVLQSVISLINFGPGIKAQQQASENMMNALLSMPDAAAFIRAFIVVAIVPAFGEELFFRAVLMRFAKKRSRTMVFPILFTAAVFSFSHANVYGYLSIFLAGILLAVIYNLTGSIWCSIAAHLFFNGFQVILTYFANTNAAVKRFTENNTVPVYFILAGAIVFAGSFYLLLKNKTPLPDNWASDFTPQELNYDLS